MLERLRMEREFELLRSEREDSLPVEDRLRQELRRRFRKDDKIGPWQRRRRLRRMFGALAPADAASLRRKLRRLLKSDPTSRLFHGRLHRATRRELLRILSTRIDTDRFFFHIYIPDLNPGPPGKPYPASTFIKRIQGPPVAPPSADTRWTFLGIDMSVKNDADRARTDFEASLRTPAALVVYFGHSVIGRGLDPRGEDRASITTARLSRALGRAHAKIILLMACASDSCVVVRRRNPCAVIALNSPDNDPSNVLLWARAMEPFMNVLTGFAVDARFKLTLSKTRGTVGDAVQAANTQLEKDGVEDRFVQLSGDRSLQLTSVEI